MNKSCSDFSSSQAILCDNSGFAGKTILPWGTAVNGEHEGAGKLPADDLEFKS